MNVPRKVLVVAYHFPPDPSVGAIRPAKFVKYLRRAGWEPIVVTAAERRLQAPDPGRLADVADVEVIRVRAWPTPLLVAFHVRDAIVARVRGLMRLKALGPAPVKAAARPGGPKERTRVRRMLARQIGALLELPDRQVGWLVPAVWASYRALRRHGIRYVVTSSPPRTTAVVGLVLTWFARVHLVTDLRDPWFLGAHKEAENRTALSDRIERGLERQIIERSKAVVTTTERYRRFLGETYRDVDSERFATIWNGYDPEDFDAHVVPEEPGRFVIAYLGSFYFGRTPRDFLEGFRRFVKSEALTPDHVVVCLVGNVEVAESEPVSEMIRQAGLTGYVELQKPVPYRNAIRLMQRSQVLLLFAPSPTHDYSIPGKTFEYIASGARILCFCGDGATADLMRWTGAGEVIGEGDADGVARALSRFYREYSHRIESPLRVDRRTFDRRALTTRLIALLEGRVVGSARRIEEPTGGAA